MTNPHPSDADSLRAFLADRDIPCPGCGYNLRGLPTDRCPECNQPLQLSVTLQDSRVGALLAAIIPAVSIAGAGAALVLFVLLVMAVKKKPLPRGDEGLMLIWLPLAAAVLLGLPTLWLALPQGRAWFRSRAPGTRRGVIWASWLASSAFFIGYFVLLMSMW